MATNAPFKCPSCDTAIVNPASWIAHVLSKAHRKKVSKPHPNEIETKCFIFVTGPNASPADLVMHFLRFGLVVDVEKVTPRGRSPFYFVEFSDEIGAVNAMAEPRQIIKGQQASVFCRKADVTESNTVNTAMLVNGLMTQELPIGQARSLIELVEMTQRELDARETFRAELEQWLRRSMRDSSKVYIFGSCLTGLGLRGTDIDFYIDFCFQANEQHLSQKRQVKDCAGALRRLPGINSVHPITSARVPIVKFFSKHIGVNVDLSFRNVMSVRNSELIRTYVTRTPWVRRVLMVLRWWAKIHGVTINGRHPGTGFSNYAFSWLVLFALMNSPEDPIPSVAEFQEGAPVDEIEGWNCGFSTTWPGNVRENVCIFKMMLHFFEFYSNLDFGLYVLCPLIGKVVSRFLFGNPDRLGPEFLRYKEGCSKAECDLMPMNAAVCLQDPFELNFNIARAVSQHGTKQFAVKCKEALEIGRLWFGTNPVAALYPLIFMSLGEEQARRLCQGHYVIPFRPGFANPSPLPGNVFSFGVGYCSLAHSFGRSDLPSTMEAYRTYWDQAVVAAVETILAECLFFDVWTSDKLDADAVDHLENFKAEFLDMYRADVRKQYEHVVKQRILLFTQDLQRLKSKLMKMEEKLGLLCQREGVDLNSGKTLQDTKESGSSVPNKAFGEINQTKKLIALMTEQERSLNERLKEATVELSTIGSLDCAVLMDFPSGKRDGKGSPVPEASLNPRMILGQPIHGPLEKRSVRAECLKNAIKKDVDSRLDQKHILATFFCELRHASLLRKTFLSSRRNGGNPVLREKYATAKFLYTLKKPPQFDIDDVPSRQIIVTVGRTKESMAGVEIIVGESPCVAGPSGEGKTAESQRVLKSLVAFFDSSLIGILEEKEVEAFGRDSLDAEVDDQDTKAGNGGEPAKVIA